MNIPRKKLIERHVAVDNVCAWPNVKQLASGEIGAFIFNRPSHGKMEGDIELWVSDTGISPWRRKSTVTAHAPNTVRMNMAANTLGDGTIISLASGWDLSFSDPIRTQNILANIQICRSDDAGATWSRVESQINVDNSTRFIPFGNVVEGHGIAAVAMYGCRMASEERTTRKSTAYLFASLDRGLTWEPRGVIGADGYTETDILPTSDGWLAAARTLSDYEHPDDPHGQPYVQAVRANAAADSWSDGKNLTLPDQHPGNLLRLKDGNILFTCGSRIEGFMGVFSRVSADEGHTWSDPLILIEDGLSRDMGYPSTIQLDDGRLLTAYYAKTTVGHNRYHLATALWELSA